MKHKFVSLPPVFEVSDGAKEKAFAEALINARGLANSIATDSNLTLGQLIYAQEFELSTRGSGYHGDEDWGRGIPIASPAAGAGIEGLEDMQSMELGTPKQTITVKLKARFSIVE